MYLLMPLDSTAAGEELIDFTFLLDEQVADAADHAIQRK
jgi:hypothetical protein